MSGQCLIQSLLVIATSCLGAANGGKQTSDDAKKPPQGLRVFFTGHSFHMFVPPRVTQLAKSRGITGHRQAGIQGIGGSRVIQHWELPDEKNKAKAALKGGEVDVFTMAAHLQLPDAGIDEFARLGLQHNPKLRLLVQASWMPFDQVSPDRKIKDNKDRDKTDLVKLGAATLAWRSKLESQIEGINKRHGRRVMEIVPVGDAIVKLRQMIEDGKMPGISKPSALFRDPIGHGLGHVQALAAYCNFAVIYRISPVGLKLQEQGVSDEQHAILQRIAWDVVTAYPYAGVEKS